MGQSPKIAVSLSVIGVSKDPQFEIQTVDFLLGILFLSIILEYIKAKGLTAFGYLTSIFFLF